jgi:hypothetical protein
MVDYCSMNEWGIVLGVAAKGNAKGLYKSGLLR